MKARYLLSSFLLAAACGGGGARPATPPGPTGGDVAGSGNDHEPPAPTVAPSPELNARMRFTNPGGMWLPSQMLLPQHAANLQAMGVQMTAEELSNPLAAPLAAVVSLGGCTASFVSPDGLIVTNHHCVQGALQFNATEADNLVENGFLARTKADEKSAGPAQKVSVAQAFTDVTKQMRDGLDAIKDPTARKNELETRLKKLTAACEKDRPGIRCDIKGFFRGAMYQQIEYLEIRDVRLVYAPRRSIGNYGGEIDNWAWPRHTGDFGFYRAYVGKDGKPADFAADNVPYHPAHFLKVAHEGLNPSDFVMVVGYPGTTTRIDTASEVHSDVEWYLPYLIEYYKQRYNIADGLLKAPGETAIKAGVAKQMIQNGLEKNQGVLAGMLKGNLLAQKDAIEAKVKAWAAKPGNEAYQTAIDKLEALLTEERKTARVDFDRSIAFGGSRLLGTALQFVRLGEERPKKDAARKPGYQDRDMPRMIASQKGFAKAYDRTLDRAMFTLALTRALDLPAGDRPWLAALLGAKKGTKIDAALIASTLDGFYGKTTLEDEKIRLDLLQKGTTVQLKQSKDPFIMAALRVWPTVKSEEKKTDAQAGLAMVLAPMYAEAMRQALDGFLSPDANSTLRVTYGTVKSFKPLSKDPADRAFTYADQIQGKDTGEEPFDAPAEQLAAIKANQYGPYADGTGGLPVDFLSDLDITGGNSGSPTINSKGELVGLAFDGTLDGVASDVVWNGDVTRTIHVDARYMLWTLDMLDGAGTLVTELGFAPHGLADAVSATKK